MLHSTTAESRANLSVLTVTELSSRVRVCLEGRFQYVAVRGEISNLHAAASGHVYLRLKDELAVLDAVCWRGQAQKFKNQLREGLEVVCEGRVSAWRGRSTYQLVIEEMKPAGDGAWYKLFLERKSAFEREGLFEQARKRPLPFLPERIGVVTSQAGAVLHDILHRLRERCPRHVLLWPVTVQGTTAAPEIVAAIEGFNALPQHRAKTGTIRTPLRPQLLIVARGGGSIEELWPFNEEAVVRAVASSAIPVICAIGHETDVTLAELAADWRAPTPTAAAERAVPVRADLLHNVQGLIARAGRRMEATLKTLAAATSGGKRALIHPSRLLRLAEQDADARRRRLKAALKALAQPPKQRLAAARAALVPATLNVMLKASGERRLAAARALARLGANIPVARRKKLQQLGRLLAGCSYRNILKRGYTVLRGKDGHIIARRAALKTGVPLTLTFHDGDADMVAAPLAPAAEATPRSSS